MATWWLSRLLRWILANISTRTRQRRPGCSLHPTTSTSITNTSDKPQAWSLSSNSSSTISHHPSYSQTRQSTQATTYFRQSAVLHQAPPNSILQQSSRSPSTITIWVILPPHSKQISRYRAQVHLPTMYSYHTMVNSSSTLRFISNRQLWCTLSL